MPTVDKAGIAKSAEDALIALSAQVCNIIDDIDEYSRTLSPKSVGDMLRIREIRLMMQIFEETPMVLSQTVIGFRIDAPRFISKDALEELYLNELWCTMETFHDQFVRINREFKLYDRTIAEAAIQMLIHANKNL